MSLTWGKSRANFKRRGTRLIQRDHCLCDHCYSRIYPGLIPPRTSPSPLPRAMNVCCFCLDLTQSGIYLPPERLRFCERVRCDDFHFGGQFQ